MPSFVATKEISCLKSIFSSKRSFEVPYNVFITISSVSSLENPLILDATLANSMSIIAMNAGEQLVMSAPTSKSTSSTILNCPIELKSELICSASLSVTAELWQ